LLAVGCLSIASIDLPAPGSPGPKHAKLVFI
jgi:hypothetical protein